MSNAEQSPERWHDNRTLAERLSDRALAFIHKHEDSLRILVRSFAGAPMSAPESTDYRRDPITEAEALQLRSQLDNPEIVKHCMKSELGVK